MIGKLSVQIAASSFARHGWGADKSATTGISSQLRPAQATTIRAAESPLHCSFTLIAFMLLSVAALSNGHLAPTFKVVAFYTAKEDPAHISFVQEARRWFPEMAARYHFTFDTTSDWHNLNADFLSAYQVVVFLDTRPEEPAQRAAFQTYMEHGGAWMGFHFAGFALTPSAYPANWD